MKVKSTKRKYRRVMIHKTHDAAIDSLFKIANESKRDVTSNIYGFPKVSAYCKETISKETQIGMHQKNKDV